MRVHVRTFGCRANHYDSELVQALALDGGHELVEDAGSADLAIFNSCAVTAEAERDVRKAVRSAARVNPALRSVVMGCASGLPGGGDALRALPGVVRTIAGAPAAELASLLGASPLVVAAQQTGTRAVLRVQDGCNEHCTFCATTLARGAHRSRPADALVSEARLLAAHHQEIVITGIHIGSYGAESGSTLGALMQRLVRDVPRVRFRLSSLEATEVDEALLELFTEPERLAPHLHAPLQSGSDRVLRRMGRHWYNAGTYARAIERITRSAVFGCGADVIAGFPGESEADLNETMELIERLPFTYLHVFPYSARPGTAATRFPDPLPRNVARERSARLRELGNRKAAAYRASRVGGRADVIVIGGAPERHGMTGDYLTVRVDAPHARGERFTGTMSASDHALICMPDPAFP